MYIKLVSRSSPLVVFSVLLSLIAGLDIFQRDSFEGSAYLSKTITDSPHNLTTRLQKSMLLNICGAILQLLIIKEVNTQSPRNPCFHQATLILFCFCLKVQEISVMNRIFKFLLEKFQIKKYWQNLMKQNTGFVNLTPNPRTCRRGRVYV